MKPESMDAIFHALAHAMRRRILDILKTTPGASVNDVCEHFDVSRIAILKHINLLEQAGLIVSEKSGRVRQLYFNAVPIQLIYDRWTTEYSGFWASQVTDLKYAIEAQAGGLGTVLPPPVTVTDDKSPESTERTRKKKPRATRPEDAGTARTPETAKRKKRADGTRRGPDK